MATLASSLTGILLIVTIFAQTGNVPASELTDDQYRRYLDLVYDSTEFSPEEEGYDYIIVGGGTAGCPLAATLSKNYTVLVLERGKSAHADPNVIYQRRYSLNFDQANDKDSPAELFTTLDGISLARGRALGGTSMISFGFYSRGDEGFFENSGVDWDIDAVKNAYKWVEKALISRLDGKGEWQSAVEEAMLKSDVFGSDLGYNLDHVVGVKSTGSMFDENGIRHGAVELLDAGNPNNLKVIVNATAERVIFSSNGSTGVLSSTGVLYRDAAGNSHQVRLRSNGEVILSAGPIGSPQLLLLSGIGPEVGLSSVNIPVIYNQSFVGESLVDIPGNRIRISSPFTVRDQGTPLVGITKNFDVVPFTANGSIISMNGKLKNSFSAGSLSLASPTNASASPLVKFNYYINPKDVYQCVEVIRTMAKILSTPNTTLDKFKFFDDPHQGVGYFKILGISLPRNMSDHGSVEAFCQKNIVSYFNYFGGCTAGKVVDHEFKVNGINNLRVVDGSTFGSSPGTGPLATVLMLGRYVGLKMLKDRVA